MARREVYRIPAGEDCMGHSEPSYFRAEEWVNGNVVIGTGKTEEEAFASLAKNLAKKEDERFSCGDLNRFSAICHEANKKWWVNLETGERLNRNKGELLMLMVSELSEAMEGERKDLMDDKLPHRKMAEVELADCLIRIFDYAGGFGYDLQGAFEEKMAFNAKRADHSHEHRKQAGGKKW